MPRTLTWLPSSIKDLAKCRDFLKNKNPAAAKQAAVRIRQCAKALLANPQMGRPVEGLPDYREFLVPFGAGHYILRYRQQQQQIIIIRVWHDRQQPDSDL